MYPGGEVDGAAMAKVLANPLARPGPLQDMLLAFPPAVLRGMTWGALGAELAFAPLALVRRLRPFAWAALFAMHAGLIVLIDFADLSLGMILLHLFTFDPAWIPPKSPAPAGIVFYDGACGLCHRTVRFVLAEDSTRAFRFAPLASSAFESRVTPEVRLSLPDSIVVLPEDGHMRVRSEAIVYIGSQLGGAWRVLFRADGAMASMI
jgi:predicted DCC family thiol-disulfide oxidoreductase YuxK